MAEDTAALPSGAPCSPLLTDPSPLARSLRVVWLAVCAGAALALGVMGALAASAGRPAMPQHAQAAFYTVAVLSMASLAGAFWLARRMEARLLRAGSDAEAERVVRSYGVAALAAAEVPVLAGALAALLTGDLLALAFGAPLFAFAWLTWPSDGRVGYWLDLRRHG